MRNRVKKLLISLFAASALSFGMVTIDATVAAGPAWAQPGCETWHHIELYPDHYECWMPCCQASCC